MRKFKILSIVSITIVMLISSIVNYVAYLMPLDNIDRQVTDIVLFFCVEFVVVFFSFIIIYSVLNLESKLKDEGYFKIPKSTYNLIMSDNMDVYDRKNKLGEKGKDLL